MWANDVGFSWLRMSGGGWHGDKLARIFAKIHIRVHFHARAPNKQDRVIIVASPEAVDLRDNVGGKGCFLISTTCPTKKIVDFYRILE